ncbi:MAG: serine/threonine-protein kinase [Solirubrobacteraceae bacterium]
MRPSEARMARDLTAATDRATAATDRGDAATASTRGPGRRGKEMPSSPLVLDRYRLYRRLGSGAFGTVWQASDERLERDVAVKILPRERIMGGRFEREARVAARLSHPGIVTLYEASMDDEGAYLVSELVRGSTLDHLLESGQLSDQDIVSIGIVLCDALEHAHGEGIVHRDVKPSNILVPERPASPAQRAKLTDFGIARVLGGDSLTRTGDVVGTLAYMAPEQAEGLQVGPSADLYSLALVLYEALTGVNPVRAPSGANRPRRLGTYLPPLRRQRRDLPRELGSGIDMALRPRPRERGRILDLRRALVAAHAMVSDEAGVVGDAWTLGDRDRDRDGDREPDHDHDLADDLAPARRWRRATEEGDPVDARARRAWPSRGLGALGAGGSAAWLGAHALHPSPLPAAVLALAVGGLTLVFPRIGWLALTFTAAIMATAQGHPGVALLLLPAGLISVLLLPRHATSWPLPAFATALGLIGLAGAWPALASRASSVWRRAALGAAGWIGLLLLAPLAGHGLYLDWLPGSTAAVWSGSLRGTVDQVLTPMITSGALVPAAIWALAAAVLPWLVRGRSLVADSVLVVVWSATVVSTSTAAIAAVHGPDGVTTAPAAVLGAAVGAIVALAPVWLPAPAALWQRGRAAGPTHGPTRSPAHSVGRQFP